MSEWISVKDRLPTEKETVLIIDREGIFAAYFNIEEGYKQWQCSKMYTEPRGLYFVTHWMPLPESPAEPT